METNKKQLYKINPFFVGGSFFDFRVKQGWMVEEKVGKKRMYYISEEGINELREKFNIIIEKRPVEED